MTGLSIALGVLLPPVVVGFVAFHLGRGMSMARIEELEGEILSAADTYAQPLECPFCLERARTDDDGNDCLRHDQMCIVSTIDREG